MRILGSVLLVALSVTVAHAGGKADEAIKEARVQIATPAAVKAHDTLTISTQTTFSRRVGKKLLQGARSETTTVEALKVKGARINRAKVTRGKVTTSGALASVAWTPDTFDADAHVFGVDLTGKTRAQIQSSETDGIVFDAGDGLVAVTAGVVPRLGWLASGVPLRTVLAGKTFTPGTAVELGGNDIDIVYQGLTPSSWSSLPGAKLTLIDDPYHADIASFTLTTSVALVLADGTKVKGDLAGTMTVDVATAMVRTITLEGDLHATDDGELSFHVMVDQALTNNENITE